MVSSWLSIAQINTLVYPKNNITISDRNPVFKWNMLSNVPENVISISQDSLFIQDVIQNSSTTNNYQYTSDLESGKWFWKVEFYSEMDTIVSPAAFFHVFEPTDLSNIIVWYKPGDDDLGTSNILNDRTQNNFHALQANIDKRPEVVDANINPNYKFISFDGENDRLSVNFQSQMSHPLTSFCMWDKETQNIGYAFDGYQNGKRNALFTTTDKINYYAGGSVRNYNSDLNGIRLNTIYFSNSSSKIFENGLLKNQSSVGSNNLSGLSIGSRYNSIHHLTGGIGELIFYNYQLSEIDTKIVEKYLMDRIQPPINLGEDLTPEYDPSSCLSLQIGSQVQYKNYLWSSGDSTQFINIESAGTYILEVVDLFDRISIDTILIYDPVDSALSLNKFLCFNQDLVIEIEPDSMFNFLEWSDGDSSLTKVISDEGYLSYSIIDQNSCTVYSPLFYIPIDSSLQDISLGLDTSLCSGNLIQLIQDTSATVSYTHLTLPTTGSV